MLLVRVELSFVSFRVNVENVNLMLRFEIYTSLYEYEMRCGISNAAGYKSEMGETQDGQWERGNTRALYDSGLIPTWGLLLPVAGGKLVPLPRVKDKR